MAAQSTTLAWDPSTGTNVVGYVVHYGGVSGVYTNEVTVGDVTNATISGLVEGATYYFSATAYAGSGLESDYATEIAYTVPTVNMPPTLNSISSVTVNEDAAQQTVSLSGITSGSVDESQTLTVTASSSDTSVVPNPTVTYTSPNATGSLQFTPAANAYGTATITVTVDDGQAVSNTVVRTFTATVNAVNDTPTLNAISSVTINEDAGQQTISLSGITSGAGNESQTLTVTATSSNTGLIPNPTVTYTSPNATGTLQFTPVAGANGSATITVTVNDAQAQNNTYSRTFTVTVNEVNNPPTLNAISNVTINEDAGQQTVNLSGISSGALNESQTLTVTATSSATSVIPNPTVVYTSPNITGSLQFTPVANANGTATITVTVNDGQASSNTVTRTFTVTVNAVNDTPTLNTLGNVTINEDAGQQVVSLSGIGSGAANESQTLTVSATSSDTSVVPNPRVTYTSPNTTGSLQFTPVASASGTATITVTVNDGQASSNTVTRTFTVTVNAVNDTPTLNAISNVSINEDAGQQTVSLSGISSGAANESQTLTVTATSSNTGLIPNPTVIYTSPNTTGSLQFTPVANANGTATITVTVNDGQASNNIVTRTFTVAVNEVNNPPTLDAISNVALNEDASQQTVNLTGISSGAVNESQTLTVTATSSATSVIPNPTVVYTSPNTTGSLQFTPVANASGTATITVTVNDGQVSSNTVTRTFTVTVGSVNDTPTLNALSNVTLNEDASQQTVSLSGINSGAANESQTLTVAATSSDTSVVPNPTVTYTSPNTTGSLQFTPVANASGTATITVTVNDGQASNNIVTRTFTVTVNAVNDTPTLNALSNVTLNEDASQQTVNLAGISSGAANESQTLTVTATSSNTGLIPTPTVTYTSPNATGTLQFTPVAGANGSTTITVTVNDGQASNNIVTRTFTVSVGAVNNPPTLDAIGNVTINEDASQQTVNLTGIGSGAANESQTLTVTATSSTTSVVPNPTVTYTSPNTTGSLQFTPATNANGTVTITVTVNDGQASNNIVTRTFTVSVSAVNNTPTLNAIGNLNLGENHDQQTVSLSGISSGAANENQSLTVTATSSNPDLIPNPAVNYASPMSTGSLILTPVDGTSGTATITVTVDDGQSQNNTVTRTFTVTLTAPDAFASVLGSYNGLFYEADEVRVESAGSVSVKLTEGGEYTGSLEIGGNTYSLYGAFGTNYLATSTVARDGGSTLTVLLQIGRGAQADQLLGSVTDGSWTSSVLGDRAISDTGASAASLAGTYTMAILGSTNDPTIPAGDGVGTVVVDTRGVATFKGTLADGTAVSRQVPLSKYGQLPLFVSLYSGRGCLVSWLTFTNQADSDIAGAVTWIKPPITGASYYNFGFTNETQAVGSKYVESSKPANGPFSSAWFKITFKGGSLKNDKTSEVKFRANGSALNFGDDPLTMMVAGASGELSGTMTDKSTSKTYEYMGVVLQKKDKGCGFFLGDGLSGQISVAP